MSYITYKLSNRYEVMDSGWTRPYRSEVEAIIKRDSAESRGQVYSEYVAGRLAALLGLEIVVRGALVTHDRGLMYVLLHIADTSNVGILIKSEEEIKQVTERYPIESAELAVFDLWIGNADRSNNLYANIGKSSERMICAFDHGLALMGINETLESSLSSLYSETHPHYHPFNNLLNKNHCIAAAKRIMALDDEVIYKACVLSDNCGSVMLPDQAEVAQAMVDRKEFLPDLVERILFQSE